MDLHNRYMSSPTLDFSFLTDLNSTEEGICDVLHQIIRNYNTLLISKELSCSKLETFRSVLFYYYQQSVNKNLIIHRSQCLIDDLNILDVLKLDDEYFVNNAQVLQDIIILQIVLFCEDMLLDVFEEVIYDIFSHIHLFEVSLSSFHLIYRNVEINTLDFNVTEMIISPLNMIINCIDRFEFLKVVNLICLCIEILGEDILIQIWDTVVDNCNKQVILNLLCFLAGTCLPCSNNESNKHAISNRTLKQLFYNHNLWTYYLNQLNSPKPSIRKQINFLVTMTLKIEITKNDSISSNVIPFNLQEEGNDCIGKNCSEVKKEFFLALDALEESQKHFALQVFNHFKKLIHYQTLYKDIGLLSWNQAIFKRILTHNNRSVVYEGLIQAFEVHHYYNEEFLAIVCKSLNDVRFYKLETGLQKNHLHNWIMSQDEYENFEFVPRLIDAINNQSWNIVVICNIFDALSRYDKFIHKNWDNYTLKTIANIAEKNKGQPTTLLHRYLYRKMLKVVMMFLQNSDWMILMTVLKELLKDEPRVDIWDDVCYWLSKEEKVNEKAEDFARAVISQKVPADTAVITFTLLSRAKVIFQKSDCPVLALIYNNILNLEQLSSRFYCDINSIIYNIELLTLMLKKSFQFKTEFLKFTELDFNHIFNEIMYFVQSKLLTAPQTKYEYLIILTNAVEVLICIKGYCSSYMEHFEYCIIKAIENKQFDNDVLKYPFAIGLLSIVLKTDVKKHSKNRKYIMDLILKNYNEKPSVENEDPMKDTILSEFQANILQIILNIMDKSFAEKIFEDIPQILQSTTKKNTPLTLDIVLKCCEMIDNELINNGTLLKMCWKATLDCKKSGYFCPAADKTVQIMYKIQPRILSNNGLILLREVIDEILEQGERVPNLKISLIKFWHHFLPEDLSEKIIFDCIMHGDVLRQDQIIEIKMSNNILQEEDINVYLNICIYVKKIETMCNYLNYNLDAMVRFISTMKIQEKCLPQDSALRLAKRLIFFKTKRYFRDSYIHKQMLRILQGILLIFNFKPFVPIMEPQAVESEIISILIDTFLEGNHQESVIIMIEWIFTLHYLKRKDKIWNLLEMINDKRPNMIYSIFRVIYQMQKSINLSYPQDKNFVLHIINNIPTFSMSLNFSTRLFSQYLFKETYENCKDWGIPTTMSAIYSIINKNLETSPMDNSFMSLKSEVYLNSFNPIAHYNMECIYIDVPRLLNICTTEFVDSSILYSFIHKERNLKDAINKTLQSKIIESNNAEDMSNAQKKIMPWKSVDQDRDRFSSMNKGKTSMSDLIVVASLIERIPNLGGIARTCEIFGVKEMVIDNLQHVNNKEFLNLSVSAEKWLNISEVKSEGLLEYILQKKREKYTIIGAEQTVNSIDLKDFKWNKSTVLILGHEKYGIPPNIIPILDDCVEIPQVGIIRSLNVHVSGALCIWQYATQNVLQ